jgi:hypothetical protein
MTLIKKQFDVSQYTTRYYNFGIYCDLLEYQYQFNGKSQLLYESYAHKFQAIPSTLQDLNPALSDISYPVWKFINPTTKTISRISFWVLDDTGQPLNTPLPPDFSYPTSLNILIKKVNSHVIAVSAL